MAGKIFVLNGNEELTELTPSQYSSEDIFQRLIEKHPNILAGDQITPDSPRKWLLISSEMGVPAEQDGGTQWYIDHLLIDQDAIPTLVEVKRSTDTRIRREVVAQMLDYAANAVKYWPLEFLQKAYDESVSESNSLASIGIAPENEDTYWDSVIVNLRAGWIRLIFAADSIPAELQRIIEYLNAQMRDTEVLGVEIKKFISSDGLTTFVPSLVGMTASVAASKSANRKRMDEHTFIAQTKQISSPEVAAICEKLLRFLGSLNCDIWWGKSVTGSFIPVFGRTRYQLFGVYNSSKTTLIELQFQYMKEPFDTLEYRKKIQSALSKIPGVNIPDERIDKRPSFPVDYLVKDENYKLFIDVIKAYYEDIKAQE